jgi:hypothetical protein
MSSRNLFASSVMACLLAVGFLGIAPEANAGSLWQPSLESEKVSGKKSTKAKIKRSSRRVRIHLPVGPGSVYHDYPYYYSRGYYPKHIGGYVYYPYYYYRSYYWSHHRGPRSPKR